MLYKFANKLTFTLTMYSLSNSSAALKKTVMWIQLYFY